MKIGDITKMRTINQQQCKYVLLLVILNEHNISPTSLDGSHQFIVTMNEFITPDLAIKKVV